MKTITATQPNISDLVAQLIRPRTHTARLTLDDGTQTTHKTDHSSLLDELESNTTTAKVGVEKHHGDPRSKPAGRLDAVALLQRIDREAGLIADAIGSRRIGPIRDRLSSISGTVADADPQTTHWVHAKIRAWVITAKVITGWDTTPFTPDVPCPDEDCEKRATIRIRVEDQVAACIECGRHWDEGDIAQLANYVAWASEHLRGARHWITDAEGFPIECTICLATRQEMAARAISRRAVAS